MFYCHRIRLSFTLSLLLMLTACGGGGGGGDITPDDINTGVFLDSPVQGLTYVTDTLTGTTDAEGTFQYRDGEIVKFYINDALIGRALGGSVITPLDFSPLPPTENPLEAINALRLLQTLDTDSDPANGIILPTIADGLGLDLNMSSEASVQSLVEEISTGVVLKDTTATLQHFSTTLENIPVQGDGTSYVFSHAYSNGNTEINTSMSATLEIVNGEYHFAATLPSGYQVVYQGGGLGSYSGHESITFIGNVVFAGMGVGISDPNTDETYWLSFYDANETNKPPKCNLGATVKSLPTGGYKPGVTSILSSVMGGFDGTRMECSDEDGDYIATATFTFYLDDTNVWWNANVSGNLASSPSFFNDLYDGGLPLYQNGIRLTPATNQDTFQIDVAAHDVFNSYALVEDHTLKVVMTATDSRGAVFTEEKILYEAQVGGGVTTPTEPSTSYTLTFTSVDNTATTVVWGLDGLASEACYYDTSEITISVNDLTGNTNNDVTGSYDFSGLNTNSTANCALSKSGAFVSDQVTVAPDPYSLYRNWYIFTFQIDGHDAACYFQLDNSGTMYDPNLLTCADYVAVPSFTNSPLDYTYISHFSANTTDIVQTNTTQGEENISTVSGSPITGVTFWTSTDTGHFSGQFPLYIKMDGADVGSLQSKAITPPTTCDPSLVSWDRLDLELQPGTHTFTGMIQSWDDPFTSIIDWPEVNWEGSVTAQVGDCLIVELKDSAQSSASPDYSLIGNWCRSDNRMCIEVASSNMSFAQITSLDNIIYADYSVTVGEKKYRNVSKLGPNEYSAESQHWLTDGTSYWDNITITIENSGSEFLAGAVRWYQQ